MNIRYIIAGATASLIIAASGATAATTSIGFEGAALGFVDQTFIEDGYTIDAAGGSFFDDDDGTDGSIEYEREALTAGTLTISRASSFTFDSIDWQIEYGSVASVVIEGFLGAASVGSDVFATASSSYSTFLASVLLGAEIDSLVISAQRDGSSGGSLDAVVLSDYSSAAVPLPAAGYLLFAGLGGLAALRRRKKS